MHPIADTDALRSAAADLRHAVPVEARPGFDEVVDYAIRGIRALRSQQRGQARQQGTDRQPLAERAAAWQDSLDAAFTRTTETGLTWSYRRQSELVGLASDPPRDGATVRRYCTNPATSERRGMASHAPRTGSDEGR